MRLYQISSSADFLSKKVKLLSQNISFRTQGDDSPVFDNLILQQSKGEPKLTLVFFCHKNSADVLNASALKRLYNLICDYLKYLFKRPSNALPWRASSLAIS